MNCKNVLWLAAIVLASGCSAQNVPAGIPAGTEVRSRAGVPLTASRVATVERAIRAKSRIGPAARNGRLLYIADPEAQAVLVYTYPQLSGAGVISGFASVDGVCTDRAGYVWVLDTSDSTAWEFAHGGTEPINYVQPGDASGNPGVGYGCSIDPKSGDLAVAGSGPGITVFRNGQQTHATYWDFGFFSFDYLGYDRAGNLYADGLLQSPFQFGLVELVKGASGLAGISLSGGTISGPGGIQWDGKYLDIADAYSGTIYQTDGASILGNVQTTAACQGQFYILANHKRIIVPDPCSLQTEIYAYPSGGSAIKTVSGGQLLPHGAAISVR